MFKKILVCIDGSEHALNAARVAASIAHHSGSEVVALNVFRFSYADPASVGVWALTIDQSTIDRAAGDCEKAIEPAVRQIFEPLNVPIRFMQQAGYEAEVDAILRVAECEESDLIVLGSRGLRGAKELFLGSVSNGVLHHARCPVLIVRGDSVPCSTGKLRNIVLASDGSPHAQKAARAAVDMAQTFATSLTVLNVYEDLSAVSVPGEGGAVITNDDLAVYANQWMDYVAEPVAEMAKESGVFCAFVQEHGKPEESILSFAAKHGADLIVLGSRGLRGYQRMLLGSVSNRVVHQADCPVLVVH